MNTERASAEEARSINSMNTERASSEEARDVDAMRVSADESHRRSVKHVVEKWIASLRQSFPFSLRLQVAAWYTIAFAILLLLTGAVFYQYLEHSLEAGVDSDLQLRAQQVAAGAVVSGDRVRLSNIASLGMKSGSSPVRPSDVTNGALVRLFDAKGQLLDETPAFKGYVVPSASITQPIAGTPWQGTIKVQHDLEVRIYSRILTNNGKTVAVVQVGESLASLHTLLHQLVAALLVTGTLVLACCAIGSYWLAGRSFAPIQRLVETARKIKAGDLHQRVPVPPVHDEVRFLAVALNEMLDSLELSFSRQRRFVADASHELRTPVAVIRNKAGVALLGDVPQLGETVIALQEIRTETERLTFLLTDLLTLARGDERQMKFEREQVQLDSLVETVAAATEGLASEHDVRLTVQASHPVTVVGDEARLIQVVMNLLDNAIHYTNPGGQVCVSVEQDAGVARLTVRDTGIGIASEHLPHIFERFYRADPTRRQTGGSNSGLGLSIVDWIVRMHGGSIDVESQLGQGSSFVVTLPLQTKLPV